VVTAIFIVIVIIAVGFGFYVGNERDVMLDADVLTNALISLSISPRPIDASNLEAGYGAGFRDGYLCDLRVSGGLSDAGSFSLAVSTAI
jgi:hypothetical protein